MGIETENQGQNIEGVELPAILDIAGAENLLNLLKEHVPSGNIHLNAANVEKLTSPCVQILLSTEKTLRNQEGKFTISSPSDAFKHALEDLGFKEQLSQWSGA